MSEDDFPLEALLEKREADENDAERRLAAVQSDLRQTKLEIERVTAAADGIRDRRRSAREELSGDLQKMRRLDDYLKALDAEIEASSKTLRVLFEEVHAQQARVDQASAKLREASTSLDLVRARKDAWVQERRNEEARKEEAEADDAALRIWSRTNE